MFTSYVLSIIILDKIKAIENCFKHSIGIAKVDNEVTMKKQLILLSLIMIFKIHPAIAEDLSIEVYKSPSCGCCEKWISHLEENGFSVVSKNQEDMQIIKSKYNIPTEFQSCHTAIINDYFIEGHVPANDIKKLLSEKPDIKGLSVPGMPAGINVPGMETRATKANFNVHAVSDNKSKVYSHYE